MKRLSIVFLCLLFICIPVFADDAKLPCGIEFGMTVEQVNDILKEHNFELVLDNMFIPLEGSNILYTLDDSGLTVPCSIILTEYDDNKGLKRISFELNSDLASLLFARFYIEYYDMRPYLPVEHVAFTYGKSSLEMYFELK